MEPIMIRIQATSFHIHPARISRVPAPRFLCWNIHVLSYFVLVLISHLRKLLRFLRGECLGCRFVQPVALWRPRPIARLKPVEHGRADAHALGQFKLFDALGFAEQESFNMAGGTMGNRAVSPYLISFGSSILVFIGRG